MAFCDSTTWQMRLTLGNFTEVLDFILNINNGEIRGDVRNAQNRRMSRVRGRCEPLALQGLPDLARMSFVFRIRRGARQRGVAMSGFAYMDGNIARFQGGIRVFADDIDLPGADVGELVTLPAFDTGETGTGNGEQT